MRACLFSFVVGLTGLVTLQAVEVSPGLDDVNRALKLGMSRDAREIARYHSPYRIVVDSAPFDYIDLVTPLRRVVLLAEETTRAGNRVGQREALALLDRTRGELELRLEMSFHPLNTY